MLTNRYISGQPNGKYNTFGAYYLAHLKKYPHHFLGKKRET